MFCPFCGKEVENGSTVCGVCGKAISDKSAPQQAVKPIGNGMGYISVQPQTPPPQKKSYAGLIAVAVILAVAIIAAALIVVSGLNKNTKPETETAAETVAETVAEITELSTEKVTVETTEEDYSHYKVKDRSYLSNEGDFFKITMEGYLNLREGPATSYGVVTRIPYGELVIFFHETEDGKWAYVQYGPYLGYVSSPYIKYEKTVSYGYEHNYVYENKRVTMDGYLNVRSGPGTDYSVVCRADYLSQVVVEYYDAATNWAKVTVGYNEGWVDADYLEYYSDTDVAAYYKVASSDGTVMFLNEFETLTEIPKGATVGVVYVDNVNSTARVKYDGQYGYVNYSDIKFSKVA